MNAVLVIFWLEIVIFVLAIITIIFSLFKDSSAREVLSSISGGSQELFLNKKTKLSSSIMTVFLIVLSVLLFAGMVTIRIILNTV